MNLHTFSQVAEFLQCAEATLLAHEAANSLILGIASRLRDGYSYGNESPFLACVEADGEIIAMAIRTPPYNLLLREETNTSEGIDLIVDHLLDAGARLPGVHAERSSAEQFAAAWSHAAGWDHELAMNQRLYHLTEGTAPSGVPGRLRLAGAGDAEHLIPWVEAFAREAVGGAPHSDPVGLVERLTQASTLAVWDDNGAASMAAVSRPTPNGISLSLVYTPPERRGHGYASACVSRFSQQQLDGGKRFCTLFADLANRTSNVLYQRIGYRPLADFVEIRFLQPDGPTSS